jgi:hypothetical protein
MVASSVHECFIEFTAAPMRTHFAFFSASLTFVEGVTNSLGL